MTSPPPAPSAPGPVRWLNNQPYLLLSLTALFWDGNVVLARFVAGHVPPMTLSCVRRIGAFAMLLPFAWPHLARDWPALRAKLPLMLLLSATGPNRSAPFLHPMPVFGSAMAILLLGEQPRLFHLVGYALVPAGVIIASRQASAKA